MGSYYQTFYQIVFGTKYRHPAITPACEKDLYQFIWGIINNKKCKLYRINGIEDHIHIVSDIHPTICLSDFIKRYKSGQQHLDKTKRPVSGIPGLAEWIWRIYLFAKGQRQGNKLCKKSKNSS